MATPIRVEENKCEDDLSCPVLEVVSVQHRHSLLVILLPEAVSQSLDKLSQLTKCSRLFVHF